MSELSPGNSLEVRKYLVTSSGVAHFDDAFGIQDGARGHSWSVGPISRIEMTVEPERLAALGASAFEARLLGSARADAMSFRSRRRVLAQLGVGGLLSTSAVASAVKAAGLKAGLSLAAGTGVVGALALVLSGAWSEPKAPPAPLRSVSHAAPAAPVPVAVTRSSRGATAAAEPAAKAPVTRSAPRSSDALAAELRALEEARGAFVGGDYALALRLLDAYQARFPRRSLATEATVLRIETLTQRGDRAQATRIGRDFLARHSDGPYARRVRSLIGEPLRP